jgi:uncharacterized Zn finger protein
MAWYGGYGFRPYVPVGQRIANAKKALGKLAKKGAVFSPVVIAGRKISETFWGESWCENLERYSDMANRLPRGRSYVRNGSVVDLRIEAGRVAARVAGSELYEIEITIKALPAEKWKVLSGRCAGQIGSIIELLSGRLSKSVMEIITHSEEGLFPKPAEIKMDCSCPDGAYMCKHLAAVLYGVGRRLDERPELLFVLRKVDHSELIRHVGDIAGVTASTTTSATVAESELADVFGIELEGGAGAIAPAAEPERKTEKKKTAAGKPRVKPPAGGKATKAGAAKKRGGKVVKRRGRRKADEG